MIRESTPTTPALCATPPLAGGEFFLRSNIANPVYYFLGVLGVLGGSILVCRYRRVSAFICGSIVVLVFLRVLCVPLKGVLKRILCGESFN